MSPTGAWRARRAISRVPARLSVLACLMLACAVAAGCATPEAPSGGTIAGRLSARMGGPPGLGNSSGITPIAGKVEIFRGATIFATVRTRRDGIFSARVPTGHYTIEAIPQSAIYIGCRSHQKHVDATPQRTTHVRIMCMSIGG